MGYWESGLHKNIRNKNDNSTRRRAKDKFTNFNKRYKFNNEVLNPNKSNNLSEEEIKKLKKEHQEYIKYKKEANEIIPAFISFIILALTAILFYTFIF